jgi:hypothetical protein
VSCAWVDGHVAAGLDDDHLGGASGDAGDRAERLDRLGERGDLLLDRAGGLGDRLVEVVDVGEDPSAEQRVVVVEAALQCLAQGRELRPQLALGEVGEQRWVGGAGDQRSIIARPDFPSRSEATQSSLIPVSSSSLWRRPASRGRSRICAFR